jgi:hypothetical protein
MISSVIPWKLADLARTLSGVPFSPLLLLLLKRRIVGSAAQPGLRY